MTMNTVEQQSVQTPVSISMEKLTIRTKSWPGPAGCLETPAPSPSVAKPILHRIVVSGEVNHERLAFSSG